MALTRAALKAMGVTEKEIIDSIMEAHNEAIETTKESTKEATEKIMQKTIDDLQDKVDNAPPDDGEDWKAKYEAEVTAHTATKTGYETEKAAASKSAKLEKLLIDKYGANPKYAAKMAKEFKLEDLKDDNDSFKDFDKLIEPVKAEWSDMFGTTTTEGYKPVTSPNGGGGQFTGKTATELMEEANRNPDKINEIMSQIEAMNKPKKEQ